MDPKEIDGLSLDSSATTGRKNALGAVNAARGKPMPISAPSNMDPDVQKRINSFFNKPSKQIGTDLSKDESSGPSIPNRPPTMHAASNPVLPITGLKRANVPQFNMNAPAGGLMARRGMTKPANTKFVGANPEFASTLSMLTCSDTATGSLKFKGAVLSSEGVNFGNGREFKVSMADIEKLEELGKGNYGTVWKVVHRPTKVIMAMKEIRLSLEESVFASIIMELDVLHKAACPEIVEFYGAFFVEGCVYIVMEYMDCGSMEKIYTTNVEEGVLAKITLSTIRGLRTLKDKHNIIHRDVKPTNVLVNSKGQVKLCDFGVSGNLVASIAKTNIGCQSYMAPERIKSENANTGPATYTVQSDIWSLGLSILELAKGGYPYPPETYNNIFAQLQAICDGDPPDLPAEVYSEEARDFVRQCLNKSPALRPSYAVLLNHPWLKEWELKSVDMVGWVKSAMLQTSIDKEVSLQPALHAFKKSRTTVAHP